MGREEAARHLPRPRPLAQGTPVPDPEGHRQCGVVQRAGLWEAGGKV